MKRNRYKEWDGLVTRIVFSLLLVIGLTVNLSAQSSGPGPFTLTAPAGSTNWQWYLNGAPIPSETNETFDAAAEGMYWVEYEESATGCTGLLGTYAVVIQQGVTPASTLNGPAGQTSYQWAKDGVDLSGETTVTYTLPTDISAVGSYQLTFNDGVCDKDFGDILAFVLVNPEICDNGLDDDGDGFIDCFDTDCAGSCMPVANCTFEGTEVTFTLAGSPQPGFTETYILTDLSNVVIQTSATQSFSGVTPGDYIVYYVNFETTEGITGLTVGQPISNITGNCFLVSGGEVIKVCDPAAVCDAGTNAPNLSSTSLPTSCPDGRADLTSLTADNNPGSLALQFHSTASPTDNSTLVTDATMVTDGTYFAVFFDATDGGCYSPSTEVTVTLTDCCMAGTTAPTLDATVPLAFCDVISQELNDYTTDTPPSGAVLTWSTNSDPLITTDHLTNTLVTTAGTYYGFFYDATTPCASPTLAVTITQETSPNAGMDGTTAACSVAANGTTTVDLDDILNGSPEAGGTWSVTRDPSSGSATIGTDNVVDFDGLTAGTYEFTYTVMATAPCTDATAIVSVIVTACDPACAAASRGVMVPGGVQ